MKLNSTAGRAILFPAIVFSTLVLAQIYSCKSASAEAKNTWYPFYTLQSPNGDTQLAWLYDSYNASKVFLADDIQLWSLNSADAETSKGKTFAKGSGWAISGLQYASNGTLRCSWVKRGTTSSTGAYSGDSMQVWRLTADGVEAAAGPIYSQGAGWHFDGAVVMPDDSYRAIWVKDGAYLTSGVYTGDTFSFWTLDAAGAKVSEAPDLTKGTGWRFSDIGIASDDTFRLDWASVPAVQTAAPACTIWRLGTDGAVTSKGPVLSKGVGWSLNGFGLGRDNTLCIEWYSTDDSTEVPRVSVWALNTGGSVTAEGPDYAGSKALYPSQFAVESDGTSRTLWESESATDQEITFWSFSATGAKISAGPEYSKGAGWTSQLQPAGLNPSVTHLVWIHAPATSASTSATGSVWTFDAAGAKTVEGPVYAF